MLRLVLLLHLLVVVGAHVERRPRPRAWCRMVVVARGAAQIARLMILGVLRVLLDRLKVLRLVVLLAVVLIVKIMMVAPMVLLLLVVVMVVVVVLLLVCL